MTTSEDFPGMVGQIVHMLWNLYPKIFKVVVRFQIIALGRFSNTLYNGGCFSTLIYSISETAKLNNPRPYYYFKHIITEMAKQTYAVKGNIDSVANLSYLMP